MSADRSLLQPCDPDPCGVHNESGRSELLFVADHAGLAVPSRLGTLGLDEARLSDHIGWDIGIHGVTEELARSVDATYVFQRYSRLVIDCNRRSGTPQSIAMVSDGVPVPGNAGVAEAERRARETEILLPYQRTIERLLDARGAEGRPVALVAMHSCTARLHSDGRDRPWQISLIARDDWRLGDALAEVLARESDLVVGINEPYVVDPVNDYTVPVHAETRGLPHVEIEIRQDLIADADGRRRWAELLGTAFPRALERMHASATR